MPPFKAIVGPVIIAHRGGSLEAPENTIASIRHGVDAGSDWQEVDVTLSSDGHVVVFHDDTLERTTEGRGDVEAHTLAQLQALHTGAPRLAERTLVRLHDLGVTPPQFGTTYADERVPTLAQILAIPNTRLMIEMKHTARVEQLATAVLETIYRSNAADRVALGSFDPALVDAVHRKDPSIPLVAIVDDVAHIEPFMMLPISVVACRYDLLDLALQHIPQGIALWVWTAYTVEQAKTAAEKGAHGIITDAPRAVVEALRNSES